MSTSGHCGYGITTSSKSVTDVWGLSVHPVTADLGSNPTAARGLNLPFATSRTGRRWARAGRRGAGDRRCRRRRCCCCCCFVPGLVPAARPAYLPDLEVDLRRSGRPATLSGKARAMSTASDSEPPSPAAAAAVIARRGNHLLRWAAATSCAV